MSVFAKKYGPLKGWQWAGAFGVAVGLGLILRARNNTQPTTSPALDGLGTTDPWTGFPYGPDVQGSGGGGVDSDGSTLPDMTTISDPGPSWSDIFAHDEQMLQTMFPNGVVMGAASVNSIDGATPGTQDSGANVGQANGANSARGSHVVPTATPASVHPAAKATGSKVTSGVAQKTTGGNAQAYQTIIKDGKVYHYYEGRTGPSKYVYIRKATHNVK